tara:strand:- start:260 stop:718 length:459 start_codon:yes stop_codon:yes gene_type:complete
MNSNIVTNYTYTDKEDSKLISSILLNKLETTPTLYYYELCNLKNKYTPEFISKIINDISNTYIYNGNHLHALVYLTGKLDNDLHDNELYFYGKNTYILENLSIYILEELNNYDIDLYCVNANNYTPLDCLFHKTCTTRNKNKAFITKFNSYY